jgi:hypothetical protein
MKSYLLSAFCLLSSLIIPISSAKAENYPTIEELSTDREVVYEGQVVGTVKTPEWSRIGLVNFPAVNDSGQIGTEFNSYAGYDLSRTWQSGDFIGDIIKLGDLKEALEPQKFSFSRIAAANGWDLDEYLQGYSLDDFSILKDQSIASLATAIPALKNLKVSQVAPIADLLESKGYGSFGDYRNMTIGQIAGDSRWGELGLDSLNLEEYSLDSIPGLENSTFDKFQKWQNAYANGIPGLIETALGDYPKKIESEGLIISRIDYIWQQDSGLYNTVSGGRFDPEQLHSPCPEPDNCPNIELDDIENSGRTIRLPTEGYRWIAGQDPESGAVCPRRPWGVEGGYGPLKALNCGMEPTGRHPFGKGFKVAVWQVDEASQTLETAIFFRTCIHNPFVDTCSPYFIGPIPFIPLSLNQYIFIGSSFD